MNDSNNTHNSDDSTPQEPEQFEGSYVVDEDTEALLNVVVGMLRMLAQTQVDENARENCFIIAQELADRFVLEGEDIEVEEIIHGDEILYRPRGGVMGDEEPEEGEAPSGKPN